MKLPINKIFEISSTEEFEKNAFNIFDFQMQNNSIYYTFCKEILKNKEPKKTSEIPFLPVDFFKTEQIICKNQKIEEIFLSSGTKGNQSKHLVSDLSIYEKSFEESFHKFYGDVSNYCIVALLPNYMEREGSSLIYMLDNLIKRSNNSKSGFYLEDYTKLYNIILENERNKQKTILFGVSYALLDFAKKFQQPLKNSIIIETGGMKGKQKELLKEELHKILKYSFGLKYIHSEYGMTELLSQSYSQGNNIFTSPPWKKIFIRDINDPLSIIGTNKTGGINIIDLANIYSCPFIATQDLGKIYHDGTFSLLGRFDNADLRGCNLLVQ